MPIAAVDPVRLLSALKFGCRRTGNHHTAREVLGLGGPGQHLWQSTNSPSSSNPPALSRPGFEHRSPLTMMQEMSMFGAQSAGEGLGPWQRENVRPFEFFA